MFELINNRNYIAGIGLGLVVGVGLGVAVESHTNEVARGKIVTAITCKAIDPESLTITEKMRDCFNNGVPGGNNMKDIKFKDGDPIQFINSYVASQRYEAAYIEPERIVAWSAVPFAGGVAAIYLFN